MNAVIYRHAIDLWEIASVIDLPANALQEMNEVIDRHANAL